MPKNDFDHLFNQLESLSVGFAPIFRDFRNLSLTPNYPPHNIVRKSENVFILEIAVAGFGKEEIAVQEHQGEVIVTGTKLTAPDDSDEYQYRGIGKRSFEKKFKLAEFMEVVDAQLANGLLSVTLMKNVPDQAKPKLIAIR
jgi:molecular chaperone IbpA